MEFSPEVKHKIEELAGVGYSVAKIAMYLDIPHEELQQEWEVKESVFHYHYARGMLKKQAELDLSLAEAAKGGSITAVQSIEKRLHFAMVEECIQNVKHGLQ
jgi:hypothetical protein